MLPLVLFTALLLHPGDNPVNPSDRSRDGLRGPVKSYTEESVSVFEIQEASGVSTTRRASKVSNSAAYALDGRILERRQLFPDSPEAVTEYHYDSDDRLIEEQYSSPARTVSTQAYSYDQQGRRVKTVKFPDTISTLGPGTAVAGFPWEDSTLMYQPYGGGTLTTVYNKDGKAMEGEFRNLHDQPVLKFNRMFDAGGNVIEEKKEYIIPPMEDTTAGGPKSHIDGLPELNDAQKKALATFITREYMAGGGRYRYDNAGRLIEKHAVRGAIPDETTRYEYNDQGDVSTETIVTAPFDNREWSMDDEGNMTVTREAPKQAVTASQFQRSYQYTYDSFGNWIRRITRQRSKSDDPWTETQTAVREITYF